MKTLKNMNIKTFTVLLSVLSLVATFGITTSNASAASACTSYVYAYGSSGQCVRDIQSLLDSYHTATVTGYQNLVIDGSFGSLTKASVQNVQRVVYLAGGGYGQAITADGIVGPNTWRKLCTMVNSGQGNFINQDRDRAAYNDANCAKYGGAFRF